MGSVLRVELERWLAPFLVALEHQARARMCPVYVAGLIGIGEHKSVQPMALRDGVVGYGRVEGRGVGGRMGRRAGRSGLGTGGA